MVLKTFAGMLICLLVAGCLTATPYGPSSVMGGYSEQELEPGFWRVKFQGNGITEYTTAQTFWLYRCAELTLDEGFEGFEVISIFRTVEAEPIEPIQVAAAGVIYIPVPSHRYRSHPSVEGDIRLLNKPFVPSPKKLFDAALLKATLEPHVRGEKCDGGNVCATVPHYLIEPGSN